MIEHVLKKKQFHILKSQQNIFKQNNKNGKSSNFLWIEVRIFSVVDYAWVVVINS